MEKERKYRPLDTEVDLDVIQSWRQDCCNYHGSCCNDRYSETLSTHLDSLHLVDVEHDCLVTLPSTTRYIALSYVWGRVPMLKTTKDNIYNLRREGALCDEGMDVRIADTVRDAMHLVKRLGERYLWVDCLCIIQDAGVQNMEQMLRAMGYVYASAEFTIVAASGDDANYGLRGVGGPSRERNVDLNYVPWDLISCHGYSSISPWVKRGWTFQESLFSRRLLIFDTVVTWLCGKVVQYECFEDMAPDGQSVTSENTVWPSERAHLGVPMGMMSLVPRRPSLGRWGMLVQDYSTRSLTYQEDAIRAFAGATEIMAATFPGGILHGLPVFFFDIALLWQPESRMVRRSEHPSWSWNGWQGSVDCWQRWHVHYAGIYRKTGEATDWMAMAPLRSTAIYQLTTTSGTAVTPADQFNGFYRYQALRAEKEAPLPPGWERHEHTVGPYYTTSITDRREFRFGFPLPSAEPSQMGIPPDISSILICTAPIVTVTFGARPTTLPNGLFGITVHSTHAAACLSLQDRLFFKVEEGTELQLLAISQADVNDSVRLGDWFIDRMAGGAMEGIPKAVFDSEPFYNVLWIEWDEDIAYRKALGIVGAKEWDDLGAEVKTIKLG